MLIEVLTDMDNETFEAVSTHSKNLNRFVKLPMLYLLITAGLQSGLSIVFLKLTGELTQSGQAKESSLMLTFLCVMMALSAVSQTHSLNMAMKYYDQLEVMPIF